MMGKGGGLGCFVIRGTRMRVARTGAVKSWSVWADVGRVGLVRGCRTRVFPGRLRTIRCAGREAQRSSDICWIGPSGGSRIRMFSRRLGMVKTTKRITLRKECKAVRDYKMEILSRGLGMV